VNAELFNFLLYIFYGQAKQDEIESYLIDVFNKSGGNPVQFISVLAEYIADAKKIMSVNTGEVIEATVTTYEGLTNSTLFPGDPVRLFLSTLAAIVTQQNVNIDYLSKQNFLRFASGIHLNRLGELLGVFRLGNTPAKTTLVFSLAEPRTQATVIPQGTRATATGNVYFATDTLVMISPGNLSAEVSATCLSNNEIGNGILPGQINRLVDPIAFVTAVENTDITRGGTDVEDDESMRNRIRLRPESFTTAGSRLAYAYWALTAHANIGDVAVISPIPGVVEIFVMQKGGEKPDPEVLQAVKDIFGVSEKYGMVESESGDRLRPLTDIILVKPVHQEQRSYSLTWYISREQGAQFKEIERGIESAVAEYETWQTAQVGRDIIPDKLISLCRAAGAKRIKLEGLNFERIDATAVVKFVDTKIIEGGIE